jgi:hypothetical protein
MNNIIFNNMTETLSILLLIVVVVWLLQRSKLTKQTSSLSKEIQELKFKTDAEKNVLQIQIQELETQKKQLEKYQTILDAEGKAQEILNEAETKATSLLSNANEEAAKLILQSHEELAKAKTSTEAIQNVAIFEAKNLKAKAEAVLQTATIEAGKIIQTANKRAEEIAGDAYEAMKKADSLEKTAKAMKNIIEGYGDQYIIPTYTLLDQLADEFNFTEAGEELKKCRDRMRLMIKNGTAAKCDYVETYRKDTAISFVLDAFNGKVDSILANLKNDNHGTLAQKIEDAFHTVNNNGKAFRNAVITEEYLQSRLEELKWAATVMELKFQEREEQRRIKEQIREEEKAKRDFERALKEAEKEEELLKKAMEKVQKELGQATEEQKAKYESQLQELGDRLKAAEEKNQRALSMAQQTKTGHVYIISNVGSFGEHIYKVGMTRRLEPHDRIRELGDASVPFEFDVHSMILSEDAPNLERELHKKFVRMQVNKVNSRKEFFKISLHDIKAEIEKMGINAKWTIAADAREWKESLAIENAIKNNVLSEDAWAKRTLDVMPVEVEDEQEP